MVLDASGRIVAPAQTSIEPRPAGPWNANAGVVRRPSILEELTLEQLERLAASNRDRGIRISPELRAMLERRRFEYGGDNFNTVSNPDGV